MVRAGDSTKTEDFQATKSGDPIPILGYDNTSGGFFGSVAAGGNSGVLTLVSGAIYHLVVSFSVGALITIALPDTATGISVRKPTGDSYEMWFKGKTTIKLTSAATATFEYSISRLS